MRELHLTQSQYLEFEKLALGAFLPVTGFMDEDTFYSVVTRMRLPDGQPFTLPILLDLSAADAQRLRGDSQISLIYQNKEVGQLLPNSFYTCDKVKAAEHIFGTSDMAHPGVRFFMEGGDWFVGGSITSTFINPATFSKANELTPVEAKTFFKNKGWKTIVGFQTRNVPHRAHEYLQRVALEYVDGLFLHPLVGRKKRGDYSQEAILAGYQTLVQKFYPSNRVVLSLLTTAMRYAGPREAVFHAIIRRNYGCTHFIVGRDHAGVGSYYDKYAAHQLAKRFEGELGIIILPFHGPFYCQRCDGIVTEKTCPHHATDPQSVKDISGTDMRSILTGGSRPDPRLMRPEIVSALQGLPIFIEHEDT